MPDQAGVPIQITINQDGSTTTPPTPGGSGIGLVQDFVDTFQPGGNSLANYLDLGRTAWTGNAVIKNDGSGLAFPAAPADAFFSPVAFDDPVTGNTRIMSCRQMLKFNIIPTSGAFGVIGFYAHSIKSNSAGAAGDIYIRYYYNQSNLSINIDTLVNGTATTLSTQASNSVKTGVDLWLVAYTFDSRHVFEIWGNDPESYNDHTPTGTGPGIAVLEPQVAIVTTPSSGSGVNPGQQFYSFSVPASYGPGRVGFWAQNMGPSDRIKEYRCRAITLINPTT